MSLNMKLCTKGVRITHSTMIFRWTQKVSIWGVFCISLVTAPVSAAEFRVGVVPQFDVRELRSIWQPLLALLSEESGHQFILEAVPTIPEFERQFQAGEFDFAYMNPYHAVVANQAQGYVPLMRDVDTQLKGILVVAKDGKIARVEDLNGQEVAFPAPNALGASLLLRSELERRFGVVVVPRYVKTHSSVYLNVALGLAAAGGGVQRTLSHQDEDIKGRLQVLFETREVPSHPIVAHSRVPAELRQQVVEALLRIAGTEKGAELLAQVPIKRLGRTSLAEYDVVAQMALDKYIEQE